MRKLLSVCFWQALQWRLSPELEGRLGSGVGGPASALGAVMSALEDGLWTKEELHCCVTVIANAYVTVVTDIINLGIGL